MTHIFITGVAGFIGMHLARYFLKQGYKIIGIDNLNDYYDVHLKKRRLQQLESFQNFTFYPIDITNKEALQAIFSRYPCDYMVHLAAQAGVRYSMQNPEAYTQSNLVGFMTLLDILRNHPPKNFIFASSSSVYGNQEKMPLCVKDCTDFPISLYAATKKSNELLAYAYAHLYALPTTGLRFFTVYGPWGRPDMSYFKFTHSILHHQPLTLYHQGALYRDFTYIDDVILGISALLHSPAENYALYNIGNHHPENIQDMIYILEELLGQKAIIDHQPLPAGDVLSTYADTSTLQAKIGFTPHTPLREGLEKFTRWYLQEIS